MNLHCTMVREVSDGATSQVVSVNAEMTHNGTVVSTLGQTNTI